VPNHVGVHLEVDLGLVTGALDQLGEPGDGESLKRR
jgi:hypothetical protein